MAGIVGIDSEAHMGRCEKHLKLIPTSHWSVARERMKALFGQLDWSRSFLLSSEDRVASVKA